MKILIAAGLSILCILFFYLFFQENFIYAVSGAALFISLFNFINSL